MKRKYRYADNSEKDRILHLISETYNQEKQKKVSAQWTWRYEAHPFRTEEFQPFFICEENGKLIGLSAFLPVILKIGNDRIRGRNPVDIMIHPKHRGFGVMLVRKMLENEPLLLGVANERSEKLWKKVYPYKMDICKLYLFSYPINFGNIAYQKTGVALTRYLPSLKLYYKMINHKKYNLDFVQIREFGSDYDDFFDTASSGYEIIPIRNSQYLNWRFRDCPTEKYDIFLTKENTKIKGYAVIKFFKGEDGLMRSRVIEMFAEYNDRETYRFMIKMAIQYAIDRHADIFQFVSMINDPAFMEAVSSKKDFLKKKKLTSKVISTYEGMDIDHAFFTNEANWHLTYGDFDQDFL